MACRCFDHFTDRRHQSLGRGSLQVSAPGLRQHSESVANFVGVDVPNTLYDSPLVKQDIFQASPPQEQTFDYLVVAARIQYVNACEPELAVGP
jgi:hypothetical protein